MILTGGNLSRSSGVLTGGRLSRAAIAAVAFTPSSISGLKLWLKADTGVYSDAGVTLATNGQTVQQWNDQSGNSANATQATSGSRPSLVTSAVNGLPLVRWGSSGYMDASIVVSQPTTYYLVVAGAISTGYYFDGISSRQALIHSGTFEQMYAGTGTPSIGTRANPMCILTLGFNGASSYARKNGAYTANPLASTPGTGGINGLRLGARTNAAEFGAPDYAEILVYSGSHSPTDLANVEGYLNSRYAIY